MKLRLCPGGNKIYLNWIIRFFFFNALGNIPKKHYKSSHHALENRVSQFYR